MSRRREKNADGIHEIIGRDQLAFFLAACPLLQKRIERHGKKPGGKTEATTSAIAVSE